MELKVRRTFCIVEERAIEAGKVADPPLRKVAAVSVLENPYAGRYVEDLSDMISASRDLGRQMAIQALAATGPYQPQATAKAASSVSPASRSTPTRC